MKAVYPIKISRNRRFKSEYKHGIIKRENMMAQKPNKWLGLGLGFLTGAIIVVVMILIKRH